MEEIMQEAARKQWESYEEFKRDTDTYARTTAEAAVQFGYALKYAKDTGILQGSGYTTMRDFARDNYGLQESTASRFIGICEKYSVGGDSMTLAEGYQRFNLSQLTDMLNLPDNLIEAIPETASREEVRDIRKEYREEEKITEIERMIDRASAPDEKEDIACAIIREYLKENSGLIDAAERAQTGEELGKLLCASGNFYAKARGTDRIKRIMTGTGATDPVYISNIRTGEKEERSWEDIRTAIAGIFPSIREEIDKMQQLTPSPEREILGSPEKQEQNSAESENRPPEREILGSSEIQEQNSTDSEKKEPTPSPEREILGSSEIQEQNSTESEKTLENAPREGETAASPEIQDENSREMLENAPREGETAASRQFEQEENEEIAQAQESMEIAQHRLTIKEACTEAVRTMENKVRDLPELNRLQAKLFDAYREIGYLKERISREMTEREEE